MEMEIQQITQNSPRHHHCYATNDYYSLQQPQQQQHPYSNLTSEPSHFDFQQSMLLTNNNIDESRAAVKTGAQIKLKTYGSPLNASIAEVSPSKMLSNSPPSTSTPPQSTLNSQNLQFIGGSAVAFIDTPQQKLSAFSLFPPQLNADLTMSATDQRTTTKHDRKRPYPCAMCSSRFGSKMELEEHQNSHTGQKPFECDICQSRFNRRSTLWNHKRIHSDAKPFSCTVCQMTFKWKNSLKCHKEMHMRKNETTCALDNDIKLLTYATAAKKKMAESSVNGLPPAAAIQTVASRKKPTNKKVKRELQEQTVSTTTSANLSLSLFGNPGNTIETLQQEATPSQQHLAITHTSAQQHQQLDLSQFNHNNLLMQAIYNGNSSTNTTANSNQQQQQQLSSTDDLNSSSSSTSNNNNSGGLNLDLLQHNAQQSFLLDNSQFLSDAALTMQTSTSMRLPATFPMNILNFQQQLTADRQQQQQLSYIQTQQQQQTNIAESLHSTQATNNQSMLNYPQRTDLLLDDMQSLYQQTALDPALLLNSHHNTSNLLGQQQHHQQQPAQQVQQVQQQPHIDQFADYMLNGNPVYFNGTDGAILHNQSASVFDGQPMAFQSTNVTINAAANFNLMDDMAQISHLAKMLPYDNKW